MLLIQLHLIHRALISILTIMVSILVVGWILTNLETAPWHNNLMFVLTGLITLFSSSFTSPLDRLVYFFIRLIFTLILGYYVALFSLDIVRYDFFYVSKSVLVFIWLFMTFELMCQMQIERRTIIISA